MAAPQFTRRALFCSVQAAALAAALVAAFAASPARAAGFDPAKVQPEAPGVAARLPDPPVRYDTPGFEPGQTGFTSYARLTRFVEDLAAQSPNVQLESAGVSQEGRNLHLLTLAQGRRINPALPTVLMVATQHGNEPAPAEAALVLAQQLAANPDGILSRINVLLVPLANPDGYERFQRATASGLDMNRDHLLLRTPEAAALAGIARRYAPQVVLDLHEFTVGGRWVDKFGVVQKNDALLQSASVGNLDPALRAFAENQVLAPALAALDRAGLTAAPYHTASDDAQDKVVSMGGVQPDTGRNVYGLRNSVSILLETRGVGIGRAHFLRRVYTQVTLARSVLDSAARQSSALLAAVAAAGRSATASACTGDLVVSATHTPQPRDLVYLDATTGADRTLSLDWRAADPLKVLATRPRPCGYVLSADQTLAAQTLQRLGVTVQRVLQPAEVAGERYRITAEDEGQRQDARGAIAASQAIRKLKVALEPGTQSVPAGSYYVPLAQPMSGLVSAALEPDSQNSYVANRLIPLDTTAPDSLRRLTRPLTSGLR
ncbi:M14 family metallopeptidase [Amphibiibacter pelophylacis]|uniref:M14 family metallocarboxypeptidase n=1 Tax=Amphibiibacter pelophylacis TaxID=1799477 RepID=A0ACC6P4I3_9BURK